MKSDHEILSDGHTVWVNSASGGCIGRFSRTGSEVHHKAEDQATLGECLDCTHGAPIPWSVWTAAMLRHYQISIAGHHRPKWCPAD